MNQEIHALGTALTFWPVRFVDKTRDHQLGAELGARYVPKLGEQHGELLVGLGKWLGLGHQAIAQQLRDGGSNIRVSIWCGHR